MKKMISENRWKLLFSSILILFPQLAAFLMEETIYWLPLQCLVIHWICLLITFWDWRKRSQGKKTVNLVIWIMPVFSIAGSGFILLVKTGNISHTIVPYFMYIGFGMMFLILGNYLPKIRQNRTVGIKVKWALEDEGNWNATHRFGGKVWVVCGLLSMLCVLFPFSFFSIGLFIVVVFAAAIVPTVYSWMYYRKRLQKGEIARTKISRMGIFVTVLLTVATVIFVAWVLLSGNMTISFQKEGMTIDASGWSDYEVMYEDIEKITYEPDGISDGENNLRTNGFGNLKMSMGEFHNDRFGDYIRYTFNDCQACVILQVREDVVVINGKDEAETRNIYDTLNEKCSTW